MIELLDKKGILIKLLDKNKQCLLMCHHRSGSTSLMSDIFRTELRNGTRPWKRKYLYTSELYRERTSTASPNGEYSAKIMGHHRAAAHIDFILENNIKYNHILLFRKDFHRALLSHHFALITDIWNVDGPRKPDLTSDDIVQMKLDLYLSSIKSRDLKSVKKKYTIWGLIEDSYIQMALLDFAYQQLINAGRKVIIVEYSDLYTQHEDTGKFYNQIDVPGTKEAVEHIFKDKEFFKQYK